VPHAEQNNDCSSFSPPQYVQAFTRQCELPFPVRSKAKIAGASIRLVATSAPSAEFIPQPQRQWWQAAE